MKDFQKSLILLLTITLSCTYNNDTIDKIANEKLNVFESIRINILTIEQLDCAKADSLKIIFDQIKAIPQDSEALYKAEVFRAELVLLREQVKNSKWTNSKAGQIQMLHPSWSDEHCVNLAMGIFKIGMHYDMIVYLRGEPDSSNPSNYGNGTQWQWCWFNRTPSCFYAGEDKIITAYN